MKLNRMLLEISLDPEYLHTRVAKRTLCTVAYLNGVNSVLLEVLERDWTLFLSGTKIHGRTALRACSVNHRLCRHDVDRLLEVVRERAATL